MLKITVVGHKVLVRKQYVIDIDTIQGFSYSFMKGNSPHFATHEELLNYYNMLSSTDKLKHIVISQGNFLLISYEHLIAASSIHINNYDQTEGEIISTGEYCVFDLIAHKYL